jgi:hypothetical protein
MKHPLSSSVFGLGALAMAASVFVPRTASACGGFFCSQAQPVNQAAERIIFADNGNGTVTAVIQILYEGPSENFSWLLPISSVPEGDQIGLASDIAFTRLQQATNPQYNLNTVIEGTCRTEDRDDDVIIGNGAGGPSIPQGSSEFDDAPGSAVNVEAAGTVGAFDYTVISVQPGVADPAVPATEWLTENGYDIPPGGAALVGPYLAEGMYLLALKLTKGSDTGSIRPIKLTYAADSPMIPIKLTAVAANQDMGVMAWVLSSARAVPFNYNGLELNEARINWFNASINYGQVVNEAADEAGGQGFVTEFAGPGSLLDQVVWPEFEETNWQSMRTQTYSSFDELFTTLYNYYQGTSGFWDAVRRTVTLPDDVDFEDFRLCPSCYSSNIQFTPSALLDAVEEDVIEPLRGVQLLIDQAPYATRLYSTLSAAEMTVDPVFVNNPDLPDVNNIHQANRVIECNRSVFQFEANWRIDFPQGTTIRGTPNDVGRWPGVVDSQPPNLRVLTLAASGEGAVVADNTGTITEMLADYNASVPEAKGSDSGGFCSLGSAGPRPAPLSTGLAALLGAAGLWRLRRMRHGLARAGSRVR